jgi:hypothetical protein
VAPIDASAVIDISYQPHCFQATIFVDSVPKLLSLACVLGIFQKLRSSCPNSNQLLSAVGWRSQCLDVIELIKIYRLAQFVAKLLQLVWSWWGRSGLPVFFK